MRASLVESRGEMNDVVVLGEPIIMPSEVCNFNIQLFGIQTSFFFSECFSNEHIKHMKRFFLETYQTDAGHMALGKGEQVIEWKHTRLSRQRFGFNSRRGTPEPDIGYHPSLVGKMCSN